MKRDRLASRLHPRHWRPKLRRPRLGVEVILPAIVLLAFGAYFGITNLQEHERERTSYNRIERVDAIHALGLQSDDPHKVHLATDTGLVRGYHDREWSRVGVNDDELHALAPHPTEPLTFYASGHDGRDALGLRRTLDGGFTWTTLSLDGRDLHAIALSAADPTLLYVHDDETLRRTEDAGATWTTLATPGDVRALAASPTDARVLYAATGSGIARSDDAGESWRTISPLRARVLVTHPTNDTTLLAADDKDAHLSTDGGVTWRPLGLAVDAAITGLTIDPDDDVYYASTEDGTLHKTETGGTRWTKVWPE